MSINNKKRNKKKLAIGGIIVSALLVFVIPIVINESYKAETGYLTLWSAADVLAFYAEVLSGLITIGVLAVTIHYNRIESEKQVRFALSQANVPFFIIEQVYQENSMNSFCESQDRQIWKKEYEISKHRKDQSTTIIVLRNIGDGIAINPKYQINLPLAVENNSPKFVPQNHVILIPYNLHDILIEKVGSQNIMRQFQDFNTCVSLTYTNTSGISYTQEITFHHSMTANKVAVELVVNSISPQYVDL